MNRTSLSVAAADPGEPSTSHDRGASDLAAAVNWLDRIELVSRSLPRLPGLAAALHWLGLQLAAPLAASRFQVWQIHDWRDGGGLVQPWLESDDQAGVQRIDLAQLDLLREGEGALGLALSTGRAAVAQVRGPAVAHSGDAVSRDAAGTADSGPGPVATAAAGSARLCLAVGLHDDRGEPFAALEWWMNDAPVGDALAALTMLARLVAARAPAWSVRTITATRKAYGTGEAAGAEIAAAAAQADSPRSALSSAHELAVAMAAALPANLVLLDTELNVLLVNRQAQREFGLLPEQASGQGLAQLFGAVAGQDLAAGAAQSSTRGGVVEQQLVIATRLGPRRVLSRSSALSDAAGQVKLLMCELQTTGREPPRLAGMDGIGASVATAQFGVVRGERQRRSGSSVRRETGDAAAQTTPAARPISVSPSLSSVRAAAVMLAPRATPTVRFSTGAPPDVLVIDDHAVNQELMTQMLLHLGCRARGVGSAEQGLADLCAASVDLVLMDIRMPGMDGLQALAWIRQGSSLRFALRTPASLPVVAVTAHAVAGDAERCLAHGFDAYLAKPCRLEDLCLVLEGLLAWCPAEPTASPSEATTQMGEGIPVFDHQALLRLQALDPSGQNQLLVRVMKAFELSLQRLSSQLRSARQQRDVSAVRQAAHTLKSSSASVGALRLSGLCLDVESALRRDGATFDVTPDAANEALGEPVGRLIDEIERVQAAVPQWLNAETGVSSEAPGNDPSRAASAPGS